MSNMKCPFCNTPLVHENMSDYWCVHCNTQEQKGLYGSDKLWQELIRTRKALGIAVDVLKEIKDGKIPVSLGIYMDINDALEQITALEQKDK